MMRRDAWHFFAAIVMLWLMGPALAAAPEVRVEVLEKQPVSVGQQVGVRVTVAAPNFFTSAPPFPTLSVDGAIVTMPDDRGVHGVVQEGGQTVATIAKTYVFVARRAGEFQLPQVEIGFTYQGQDGKPAEATLRLPATRIRARLPEGAREGDAVLPAASLRIRQQLDRDARTLTAGDALVRTVQVDAANTQAMLIPPPEFTAPDGVRVFDADPQLSDHDGRRGDFAGGTRIDKVTYVFEKPGRYTLPAVELSWFDPKARKPVSTQAPAIEVEVTAAKAEQGIAPELPVAASAFARRTAWWRVAVWGTGLVLVAYAVLLAWRMRARWAAWRADRRRADLVSDAHMFDLALAACKHGDASAVHAALLAWSRRHAHATPTEWARELGDQALESQLGELQRALYATSGTQPGSWAGAARLGDVLRAAHRQWRHRRAVNLAGWWRATNPHGLRRLNPLSRR